MPLSKSAQEKLLKALRLSDTAIAELMKDGEFDVTLPDDVKILSDTELVTRDDVKLKEGEKLGEKKATEIARTEIKKHAGIDLKGERWGDIGTEIKAAINATGDDKVKVLQEQNALLLADKETLSGKVTQAETALKTGMFEINVLSKLPPNSLGLSAKEVFELAKIRGYQPELTETGTVWKKNGEILKDPATHAPLPEDKAIAHIWTEQKWTPAAAPVRGGRGGEQRPSGGAATGLMSKSEVEAAWSEQNPDKGIATPEGMAFYAQYAKQDGFDMYS